MEEEISEQKEKIIVTNINLTRGLITVLILMQVFVVIAGYMALNNHPVAAAGEQAPANTAPRIVEVSTTPRRYYLTYLAHQANTVTTACTDSFHPATIWELMDVSNFEYAVDLGPSIAMVRDDSGEGPPNGFLGWVRTGYNASTENITGQANCNVWTSKNSAHFGTVAGLPLDWPTEAIMSYWYVGTVECNQYILVWCIED